MPITPLQLRSWKLAAVVGAMHSLAVASASTPIDSTGNQPAATFVKPIEADDRPPRLLRDALDQALSAITSNRSRRSLYATASDAALEDLFALD